MINKFDYKLRNHIPLWRPLLFGSICPSLLHTSLWLSLSTLICTLTLESNVGACSSLTARSRVEYSLILRSLTASLFLILTPLDFLWSGDSVLAVLCPSISVIRVGYSRNTGISSFKSFGFAYSSWPSSTFQPAPSKNIPFTKKQSSFC